MKISRHNELVVKIFPCKGAKSDDTKTPPQTIKE